MADNSKSLNASIVPEEGDEDESPEFLDDEALHQKALECFKIAEDAEQDIRQKALEDLEFRSGKQWPDQIEQDRSRDGRPCLVINRLPQFTQQITNDARQNRPAIRVHPVSSGASKDTADIIKGLIRHIEYNSNADTAYDTALDCAVNGGLGYFRILSAFADPNSFDQEIFIKRIKNPFSVFFDPYHQEADGSDANWAFITDDLSRDDYKSQFPDSDLIDGMDWSAIGNSKPGWVTSETIRVAEYFYKEIQTKTIHQLKTGEVVFDSDLPHRQLAAQSAGLDASVVKTRKTKVTVIKWLKINGAEILERGEVPGSYIPIIPVFGAELLVNGKRILEGLIRHAKDPQRMLNYWKSAETEAIALAPRAPFIGAEGQFEGYEQDWKTANRKNHAFLQYRQVALNGMQAPPPQRQAFEPAVQAITQAAMAADLDLNKTTGIYPAAMGAQSNEIAGVAIMQRQSQGAISNFHFVDNLNRSIRHAGRILIEWIPEIYDTARAARIIGDDGSHEIVSLNQPTKGKDGKDVVYDLSQGRYDVTVDTGPSYATRRQEAAASMMDFSRAVPQVAQGCADLIAKNMDWPGAQEIADRLNKMLPPALQGDAKATQVPPQVQAQMSQMSQMVQNLSKQLNDATKVIETKTLELEHKERIELMKQQFDVAKLEAELGSKEALSLLAHQVSEISGRLKLLHMAAPIGAPNNFDPSEADGGNYPGVGHIGEGANLTGGASPGQIPGANP